MVRQSMISLLKLVQTDTQTVHNLIGFSEFIFAQLETVGGHIEKARESTSLSTKLVKYLQVT